MKRAIVVGSGAGGAAIAKELQGSFEVTVLEAGTAFRPFSGDVEFFGRLKKAGLLFDEREINYAFRHMQVRKTKEGMALVSGRGHGGSTTISAGNALRMDADLREIGIDLDTEFSEIYREIPVSTDHRSRWRPATRRLFDIAGEMGLRPQATPKMGSYAKCRNCGRCVLGCPHGVKWDSRNYLREAISNGAELIDGCQVERVILERGRAAGVVARKGWGRRFYPADLVVLAAGGFATPAILASSGFRCSPTLFVDPVLCVAARVEGGLQNKEVSMPFVAQLDSYIISPYFDYLSYFFNRQWRFRAADIVSVMIKLADSAAGTATTSRVIKPLTAVDQDRLRGATEVAKDMLARMGIERKQMFLGNLNAGHPGGMLPFSAAEATSLHHATLPQNLYVSDATLLPKALGNPPILTITALSKKIAKVIKDRFTN
jgi:choline dehydrogenase-like flavoprotein